MSRGNMNLIVVGKLSSEVDLHFGESLAISSEFARFSLFESSSLIISNPYPLVSS